MTSFQTASVLALALAGFLGGSVLACSKDDSPAALEPPAGVLNLPGNLSATAVASDEGVRRYCGPMHGMQIQEDAKSRYIVGYKLDDHTEKVRRAATCGCFVQSTSRVVRQFVFSDSPAGHPRRGYSFDSQPGILQHLLTALGPAIEFSTRSKVLSEGPLKTSDRAFSRELSSRTVVSG